MEDQIYKKLSEDLEKELRELKERFDSEIEFYRTALFNRPYLQKLKEKIFWRHNKINRLVAETCGVIKSNIDSFEEIRKEINFEIQEAIFDNCCYEIISLMNQKSISMESIIESWKERDPSLDWNKFNFEERRKK